MIIDLGSQAPESEIPPRWEVPWAQFDSVIALTEDTFGEIQVSFLSPALEGTTDVPSCCEGLQYLLNEINGEVILRCLQTLPEFRLALCLKFPSALGDSMLVTRLSPARQQSCGKP